MVIISNLDHGSKQSQKTGTIKPLTPDRQPTKNTATKKVVTKKPHGEGVGPKNQARHSVNGRDDEESRRRKDPPRRSESVTAPANPRTLTLVYAHLR
jgi:hypothetical protein